MPGTWACTSVVIGHAFLHLREDYPHIYLLYMPQTLNTLNYIVIPIQLKFYALFRCQALKCRTNSSQIENRR